jgi:hypothetical protein
MNKLKRIMAMAGVVLIISIWVATFVVGVTGGPKKLLTAFLVLSVVVPVLMYAILLVARTVSGKPATDEIDDAIRSGKFKVSSADESSGKADSEG